MQSVFQEPNLENNMTQERTARRIRQLEEEKLFADMQASKELDKRHKTPGHKEASSITVLEEENISLNEQVRKLTEQVADDVFARAWSGELGKELCGTAEARGETTLSTLNSETSCTQHSRCCVEPFDRTTKNGTCRDRCTHKSKNVQHHAETRWDDKCHQARRHKLRGTSSHLIDSTHRRLLAKTLEQERPRHLWLSLRCRSYCTPARTLNNPRTDAPKTVREVWTS